MSESSEEPDESTRLRVIRSVRQHGPSTANELAARLELTPAAVRRHLGVLVDIGQLSSRRRRIYGQPGRGRPSMVFELTDTGRAQFDQRYDELTIAALTYLGRVAGPEAIGAFADEIAAKYVAKYEELCQLGKQPTEALVTALNAEGFVASWKPAPSGLQLCLHHCPVALVAARFPQLCAAETAAIADLLGSHVQRLATIAHGDGVCTVHVPMPVPQRKITV